MIELVCRLEGPHIEDSKRIESTIEQACAAAGTTVLGKAVHHFQPQGFTGLWLLAESHATIHTWPERGYALLNYFSCAQDPKIPVFEEILRCNGFQIAEQRTIPRILED